MDRAGGGTLWVHRVAWELANGPIPDGMFVCHHCDNPPCCNPAHLFLGRAVDNVRDMHAKGRYRHQSALGDRNGSRLHPERLRRGDENGSRLYPERLKRGTENKAARLDEAAVLDIRVRLARRESLNSIATIYGVTKGAVACIRDRKTWAWLP